MIDNREPTRRKTKWAEAHPSKPPLQQEPDHVVGRDMSENKTSTSGASCVHKTSQYAENANTSQEKKEMTVMDQELDKKLTNMLTIMETNQKQISDNIKSIFNYLSRENNSRANEINMLRSRNDYNERVLKDFNDVKDKLTTYRKLFWGLVGSLVGIAMIALSLKAFLP